MPLLSETVERVRTYWRGWETGRARQDTVSVVVLGEHHFASVASVRIWDATLGHVGVYTDTEARRRGLARTVAAAAVRHALHLGLVPQWRVRIENEGSLRVADALGFVTCGRQFLVRVRESPELIPN